LILALQYNREVPFEWIELQLCREFHCLPSQLSQESDEKMRLFLNMMNIESQFEKRGSNELEQLEKYAKRFRK